MINWRQLTRPLLVCSLRCTQDITRRTLNNVLDKNTTSKPHSFIPQKLSYDLFRYKSKKPQYDSDDEKITEDDDDLSLAKDSKVVKFSTTSMRTDAILKSALAISRNKIEQNFYESKIRVNGKKILKKSYSAKLGDELDIIKMVSPKNPEHLYVSRVEILDVTPQEESITITARRFKNLLIENYENDPYKGGSSDN